MNPTFDDIRNEVQRLYDMINNFNQGGTNTSAASGPDTTGAMGTDNTNY